MKPIMRHVQPKPTWMSRLFAIKGQTTPPIDEPETITATAIGLFCLNQAIAQATVMRRPTNKQCIIEKTHWNTHWGAQSQRTKLCPEGYLEPRRAATTRCKARSSCMKRRIEWQRQTSMALGHTCLELVQRLDSMPRGERPAWSRSMI
jgi:hypothetical protein